MSGAIIDLVIVLYWTLATGRMSLSHLSRITEPGAHDVDAQKQRARQAVWLGCTSVVGFVLSLILAFRIYLIAQ